MSVQAEEVDPLATVLELLASTVAEMVALSEAVKYLADRLDLMEQRALEGG